MPALKGSKKLNHKHSLLGQFQANKKVIKGMKEKVNSQLAAIRTLENEVNENKKRLNSLNVETHQCELSDKNTLVKELKKEISNVKSSTKNLKLSEMINIP